MLEIRIIHTILVGLVFGIMVGTTDMFPGGFIALTLYNSWVADFQPQGRYIFPALFAFAFLTWGTIEVESSMVRIFRIISVLILIPLSIFILWFYVV